MFSKNNYTQKKATSNGVNNFWKISTLVLAIFLTLSLAINIIFILKDSGLNSTNIPFVDSTASSLMKTVSAKDIYPMFACGCCGKPLDQCTCGMAAESRSYINSLVETKTSENEIVLAYVKKYGLNSFVDKNKQKEVREELVKTAPTDRPVISLSSDFHDFGDVSQQAGTVITFFEIKNEGESDLIIDRLSTSCGCTSAAIVYQGSEGPIFHMPGHGQENPTDWQIAIPSGQTAQLKVYYDPDTHQDFRGPATREISVFSNDPIDFEKKVAIELNQVD